MEDNGSVASVLRFTLLASHCVGDHVHKAKKPPPKTEKPSLPHRLGQNSDRNPSYFPFLPHARRDVYMVWDEGCTSVLKLKCTKFGKAVTLRDIDLHYQYSESQLSAKQGTSPILGLFSLLLSKCSGRCQEMDFEKKLSQNHRMHQA